MIIIEGPDFSGKTTLCKKIAEQFNIEISHSGGPGKSDSEIINRMEKIWEERDHLVVRDRLPCISDHIYGHTLNRKSPFEGDLLVFWMSKIFTVHPLIILCFTDLELMVKGDHVKKDHESQEHFNSVMDNRLNIIKYYDQFFSLVPHYRYDWNIKDERHENIILEIVNSQVKNLRRRGK